MSENCFCHFNGYEVKDAKARATAAENAIKIAEARKYIENYKSTYNVLDYGVVGDGETDNLSALDNLAYDVYLAGGGTLFFPSGKYNISGTLYIGDNVRIIGEGKSTYLYGTDSGNYMGVFLALVGDNVSLENVRVGYNNDSRAFMVGNANHGAVGLGTYLYTDARSGVYTNANHKNALIRNIYSDSTYPLQTENTSGFSFENVTYENIYAESGCVSVCANSDFGVNNFVVNNARCSFLRIGWGYKNNTIVTDCTCNFADLKMNGCMINNLAVNLKTDCSAYAWNIRENKDKAALVILTQVIADNINVDCGGLDGWHGVAIGAAGSFSNMNVKNPGNSYSCYVQDGVLCNFANCNIEGKTHINGSVVNSYIGENESYVNLPAFKIPGDATLSGNWEPATSSFGGYFGVKDGKIAAHVCLNNVKNPINGLYATITNNAYKPNGNRQIPGMLVNNTTMETKAAWLAIGSDGSIAINPWGGSFFDGVNIFICNGETYL